VIQITVESFPLQSLLVKYFLLYFLVAVGFVVERIIPLGMSKEKWLTVKEFADKEGIRLAAAYKRLKENPDKYPSERKFGRLVVKG
jgi:predicted DNA-binding transcriptional regulator AlpA